MLNIYISLVLKSIYCSLTSLCKVTYCISTHCFKYRYSYFKSFVFNSTRIPSISSFNNSSSKFKTSQILYVSFYLYFSSTNSSLLFFYNNSSFIVFLKSLKIQQRLLTCCKLSQVSFLNSFF
jgi:hypothetical protein